MANPAVIKAALGETKADLVIKNAAVVDVFLHRIYRCDVAVQNGIIAGLGEYHGKREFDAEGRYLLPGLIDSHMHVESSLLPPHEYARIAAPWGMTTLIADPHEIANVCGEAGLAFFFRSAEQTPLDILFMCPSCVPATPYDHSGAVLDGEAVAGLMARRPFYGLGEVMDANAVLSCDAGMLKKLNCTARIDGHAPLLGGKRLCGYIAAGVRTDHECETAEELLEKVGLGMYVQIREGTSAKNLAALAKGITPHTLRRILFCTDDRDVNDILESGTIANCIRRAVECGMDPIDAITIATLNAAECYGLERKGAIAPGYRADFLLSEELTLEQITEVFKDGVLMAQDGKVLFDTPEVEIPPEVRGTVHLPELDEACFTLPFSEGMPAIQVLPHSLVTRKVYPDSREELNLCAVVERHGKTGGIGKGFVRGFGLKGGAVAQSIGHDSHNITVLGDNPRDMLAAVRALGCSGGIAVVQDGAVTAQMPLAIAGLMSGEPAERAASQHTAVRKMVRTLVNNPDIDPLMLLSFLSLVVIPDIKLNDSGLFDVLEQRYLE